MTSLSGQPNWIPINLLGERFAANLRALSTRRAPLAEILRTLTPVQQYFILPQSEAVLLGVATPNGIQQLPQALPPAGASQIVQKLCPAGACTGPLLVVGEDLGWLWNGLYNLPCQVPAAPGHRPPLFFLVGSLERLWLMLHIQDWSKLLADPRVRMFIGPGALDDFRQNLTGDPACPWPRASVVVDPSLWPSGTTIEGVLQEAGGRLAERYAKLEREIATNHAAPFPIALANSESTTTVRPLRILGITSRYTTFLQYSMRDWLSAFERLGHRTRLVIEQVDHEITGPVAFAEASADFQPDLVVCIDHFRKELGGLPANVPVAMWVQDALPNLFSPAAGAAQGPLDYALGFGKLRMVREFGYPASRYMSAIVGLNDERFAPRQLTTSERERFGGEVAFVSHASMPAEQIIAEETRRIGSPEAGRLLAAIYEQLRAVYEAGGMVLEPIAIRRMIEQAMRDVRVEAPADQKQALFDLFLLRVNNALFRHQTLLWLADMDVDLRLWGRGWENHPKLKRFARGVADNEQQLPAIYQASRINLQVTPHGAVHQRMMEGLASGGFFLIRQVPGDLVERELQVIWQWCRTNAVTTDADLQRRATPAIQARLAKVAEIFQHDPFTGDGTAVVRDHFVNQLLASDTDGYIRSAATVWGDDYNAVSFRSESELRAKVAHFLANEDERREVAGRMRQAVLDRFTYVATTRRLLKFISQDLASRNAAPAASPQRPTLDLSLDAASLRSHAAGAAWKAA